MALGSGTIRIPCLTERHEFIFQYEELSQNKNSSDVWVSTVRWSVKLESFDQYGEIQSSTTKKWTAKVNGKQIDSGSNTIGMNANSSIVLASGTFSWTRANVGYREHLSFHFTQNFGITFNGQSISSDGFVEEVALGEIVDPATFAEPYPSVIRDTEDIWFNYNPGAGLTKLEFCMSEDHLGGKQISNWTNIPNINTGRYDAVMTDNLRTYIRYSVLSSVTGKTVYYLLRSSFADGTQVINNHPILLKLSDAKVVISADVYDVNPKTLAVTGDRNVFVKYASIAEFAYTATSQPEGASIVTHYVQNGAFKTEGYEGRIEGVEDGTFLFYAKDSRGNTDSEEIVRTIIDYVKPTCNSMATTELSGELGTGATVRLTIKGNYFNGSFGDKKNELHIWVKHTQNDGSMGEWVDLSPLAYETDGSTYTFNTTITGLSYDRSYTFHCKVVDLISEVESQPFTLRVLPVFDWSQDDFNFNVPVRMFKDTVLRYNMDAHNVVLSGGEEGKIYLRPGGTDVTEGEVIIYSSGNVEVSGNLDVTGSIMNNGVPFTPPVDYIIEQGSEAMGTNGTWYWEKWYSGKAVCWGTRNFGAVSINSVLETSGTVPIYRSAKYQQSFPSGLFKYTPDSIQMNLIGINDTNSAVWLQPYDGVASSSSTGGFVLTAPVQASTALISRSDISFHVTGRWK